MYMDEIINELVKKDKNLEKVIKSVGECMIGKNKQSIFSYLIGVIIGQRIRFAQARNLRKLLYEETKNYNFTPQDILKVNWENVPVDENIKGTILRVTDYFIKNNVDLKDKDTFYELIKINGIGKWTIESVMIEYNIDPDLFPLNDKHVNKKIKEIYGNKDMDELFDLWSPYKSVVFWYFWKYELKKNL